MHPVSVSVHGNSAIAFFSTGAGGYKVTHTHRERERERKRMKSGEMI